MVASISSPQVCLTLRTSRHATFAFTAVWRAPSPPDRLRGADPVACFLSTTGPPSSSSSSPLRAGDPDRAIQSLDAEGVVALHRRGVGRPGVFEPGQQERGGVELPQRPAVADHGGGARRDDPGVEAVDLPRCQLGRRSEDVTTNRSRDGRVNRDDRAPLRDAARRLRSRHRLQAERGRDTGERRRADRLGQYGATAARGPTSWPRQHSPQLAGTS